MTVLATKDNSSQGDWSKMVEEKKEAALEFIKKLKTDNPQTYEEVVQFTELLRKCGVTTYQLSGSSSKPMISTYSIS